MKRTITLLAMLLSLVFALAITGCPVEDEDADGGVTDVPLPPPDTTPTDTTPPDTPPLLPFKYVRVCSVSQADDQGQVEGSMTTPGPDIDAICLVRDGNELGCLQNIVDHNVPATAAGIGGQVYDNNWQDPAAMIGASDYTGQDLVAANYNLFFTSIGWVGNYVIADFGVEEIRVGSDELMVYEVDPTGREEPATFDISTGSSGGGGDGTWVYQGCGISGTYTISLGTVDSGAHTPCPDVRPGACTAGQ